MMISWFNKHTFTCSIFHIVQMRTRYVRNFISQIKTNISEILIKFVCNTRWIS